MLGAIIGDIAGSKYEFNNIKNENFRLLERDCFYTDDTICTIANMDWLLHAEERNDDSAAQFLKKWTNKYLKVSYGGRFVNWIYMKDPKPYGSYGNGSAMRISPVAAVAKNLEELELLSNTFTEITHNHPEGMKGALTVATCIFMALNGHSKEEIKHYAIKQYPKIKTFRYQKLQREYFFNETCQGSVPQAIYCFLISTSFEDCLKKTIAIGGDCDTTSAMSGAIAEAFYGIPQELTKRALEFLDPEMAEIVKEFYKHFRIFNKHNCPKDLFII